MAQFLDPHSSCQSQFTDWLFLSFESSLIRRTDHNRNRVSTSLAQTNLLQPYTRHSVQIGHLPNTPNAGTM
jgi:hypothetical protein